MRLSNRNLRLCVLNRFLARQKPGLHAVEPFELQRAASDVGYLDETLSEQLKRGFKDRKLPMPIDQAMEIVDLYLKQRIEP